MLKKLIVVTPIYKSFLDPIEFFSISSSLLKMVNYEHTFIAPKSLDITYYKENFQTSGFIFFPDEFFQSHKSYNQLCYEPAFYEIFQAYEFMLIFQTDAIIVKPEKIDFWVNENFDYVGAPETILYNYNINQISPFHKLNTALKTISLQGLNGGLSLRRIKKIIEVINEYPELTSFSRKYAGGIGEDIFFCLLSRVSKLGFRLPNEILASNFALTGNFQEWLEFNSWNIPFGFHAWYKNEADKNYILRVIGANV